MASHHAGIAVVTDPLRLWLDHARALQDWSQRQHSVLDGVLHPLAAERELSWCWRTIFVTAK